MWTHPDAYSGSGCHLGYLSPSYQGVLIMNDCPGLDSHFDRLFELWEDQTYAEEYEEEEECDDEE